MNSRISLGTVQFGLDYGINNLRGKVPPQEVQQILKEAYRHGVDTLDTAAAYGESEQVLGEALRGAMPFKVITKFPPVGDSSPREVLQTSIKRLQTPLYGYLLHNYHSFRQRTGIVDQMQALRQEGRVCKTGFSIYEPADLEEIFDLDLPFELVQLPLSILDRRFEPYLFELSERGVEVHCRSAFLQGLVFMEAAKVPPFFYPVKGQLLRLKKIALELGLTVAELCVAFCLAHNEVERVVVGVDGLDNLRQNLEVEKKAWSAAAILEQAEELKVTSPEILNPSKWKI
ncbi:aldo/keto reductase [Desulfogranum mediterraneum]|uniref:aldo/keto reductase n=1 Tax=Desulfogranum mediterraneum TaxID=160661 RepID=UPI00068890D3|nr:aldo/keto reductase [Desulfogranum mediterraneum]